MKELTRRQAEVLTFIETFIDEKSFPPSVRDVTNHFNLASAAGAHKHIKALVKKGFLVKDDFLSRSLRIAKRRPATTGEEIAAVEIPLLGRVAAGRPIEALPQHQEQLSVPASLTARVPRCFALQVQGDSMMDEGILDGDYVVLEPRETADNGEVVVALLNGDEATLKRFYRENGHIRLQPSNAAMQPIIVTSTEIAVQGVVVGLVRSYRLPGRRVD